MFAGQSVSWGIGGKLDSGKSAPFVLYARDGHCSGGQIPGYLIRGRGAGIPRPRLFGSLGDPDSNRGCLGVNRAVLPLDHPPLF